jgi:competence protein ComEA
MQLTTRDRVALGIIALAMLGMGIAAWLALAPVGGTTDVELGGPTTTEDPVAVLPSGDPFGSAPSAAGGILVVDVQGAVQRPGIVSLPAGSRVADALAAAGGYAPDADLAAAASSLNLAAPVSDGEKVLVPVVGAVAVGPSPGQQTSGSGLVNLNTATPEELDSLPEIGPVTVQKLVAGRAERAFTTLDELVERDIMNRAQLDAIRDLVTV